MANGLSFGRPGASGGDIFGKMKTFALKDQMPFIKHRWFDRIFVLPGVGRA
jgi:hypothetical protein